MLRRNAVRSLDALGGGGAKHQISLSGRVPYPGAAQDAAPLDSLS
jgi:hypothetical protein